MTAGSPHPGWGSGLSTRNPRSIVPANLSRVCDGSQTTPCRRSHLARSREWRIRRPVSAISVSGLRKSYGAHEAIRGIELEVGAGEVFSLLGPNGAGKTSTVEIL